MELSFGAIKLIKHFLAYTGEKELDEQGKEKLSLRRLNNEESSQRFRFSKNVKGFEQESEDKLNEIIKNHNESVNSEKSNFKNEFPIQEGETEEQYNKRIDSILASNSTLIDSFISVQKQSQEIVEKKLDITIEPKNLELIKKYFIEYSQKVGFPSVDDEVVEELTEVLK